MATLHELTVRINSQGRHSGDERRRQAAWLADIHDCSELSTDAEKLLYTAVTKAKEDGVTWELIGRALGVSRSAAQQRFSKPAPGQLT